MKPAGKIVALIVLLIIMAAIAVGALFMMNSEKPLPANGGDPSVPVQQAPSQTSGLSDEAIKDKFSCRRETDDVRDTDIYCRFPSLYRTGTISDDELKQKLGCYTYSPGPLCASEKYDKYKADLLAQHARLSAEQP